ncbi:MAG TPA: hypothetical protein VM122_07615 [Usitatibacter sp.]|nr:hypothetical protein [Usitatibacter sp.]
MKYLRRSRRAGPSGPWRIVILVRRIDVAVVISVLAHVLLFTLLPAAKPTPPPSAASSPMQVVLVSPPLVAPQPVEAPAREVTPPRPVEKPVPRPPTVSRPRPEAPPTARAEVPAESPRPTPSAPPEVDMMAAIEARRASRRAADAGRGAPPPTAGAEDAATRNLRTLTGGEGVGGVFEILEKGTRRGTFVFNGWRQEARGKWRTVIEVDAGQGGNVELAMVQRMIVLIREYYSGDFKWESHRLDRIVTLSARIEDTAGLEEFMMREFFGPPGPAAQRR